MRLARVPHGAPVQAQPTLIAETGAASRGKQPIAHHVTGRELSRRRSATWTGFPQFAPSAGSAGSIAPGSVLVVNSGGGHLVGCQVEPASSLSASCAGGPGFSSIDGRGQPRSRTL